MFHADGKNILVESLTESHPEFASRHRMSKREAFSEQDSGKSEQHLVLIYVSSASGGRCGLKSGNLKRMHAPPTKIVRLDSSTSTGRRFRRSAGAGTKMIELAVFVDEVLYASTKKKGASDPIASIQDIVFTYINSVSSTRYKFVAQIINFFQYPLLCFINSTFKTIETVGNI